MSTTFADNILPSSTGYDIGSLTQRWDGFFQNLDVSGTLTLSAAAASSLLGSGIIYPSAYGAVGDGRASTHVDITASNTTLADTFDSPWVLADVGKTIVLYSQGYSPGLVTTITGFTDSAHITVAVAPTSTTTVNAVWGTDDSAAIAAALNAITAQGGKGVLHFPTGIYLIGTELSIVNCQGFTLSGDGAASAASLGSWNLNGQRATGSALVWVGAQGGFLGCKSNTGAPPSGVTGATQNCTMTENVMLTISGQFTMHDITFIGSQVASHCVQVGGSGASNSFDWSVDRVNVGYARQYGWILGDTNANQGANYGEAKMTSLLASGNGLPNTTVPESDPTGGGDIFMRYGSGNYQIKIDTAFLGIGGVNGNHHIFGYSGNFLQLDNIYFAPLTANGTAHSSMYALAGTNYTFDGIYDENAYMLHGVGGSSYDIRHVQLRQQTTTNPHFGMYFESTVPYLNLDYINTAGLPIVMTSGGRVKQGIVDAGAFGPFPAYGKTLTSGAGSLTRSGTTLTLTTTTAHTYAVGDWVTLSTIDDATWNGTFQVVTSTTPTFTVVNANAVGASTQNGTVGLASGVVASTATNMNPQWSHPFISFLSSFNGSGSTADILSAASTNLANKNAITFIPAGFTGAAGSSLPATIPTGWHFLDMRGGAVNFYGGPYVFGSAANPATVTLSNAGNLGTITATSLAISKADAFRSIVATASTGTNSSSIRFANTAGGAEFGMDSSTGFVSGVASSIFMWCTTSHPLVFGTNNAVVGRFEPGGAFSAVAGVTSTTNTLTAAAPTVSAGQIGYGATTAATATNGTGEAMKANVEGYIICNVAGTAVKIPYVKT